MHTPMIRTLHNDASYRLQYTSSKHHVEHAFYATIQAAASLQGTQDLASALIPSEMSDSAHQGSSDIVTARTVQVSLNQDVVSGRCKPF